MLCRKLVSDIMRNTCGSEHVHNVTNHTLCAFGLPLVHAALLYGDNFAQNVFYECVSLESPC